ncbi:MAG: hypothetical protein V1802_00695 [Candidatus Aenigmatarchaeota archaeon]
MVKNNDVSEYFSGERNTSLCRDAGEIVRSFRNGKFQYGRNDVRLSTGELRALPPGYSFVESGSNPILSYVRGPNGEEVASFSLNATGENILNSIENHMKNKTGKPTA